jgi:hypothetical protein
MMIPVCLFVCLFEDVWVEPGNCCSVAVMLSDGGRIVLCTKRQKIFYELKRISDGIETRTLFHSQQTSSQQDLKDKSPASVGSPTPSPTPPISYQKLPLSSLDSSYIEITAGDVMELIRIRDLSSKLLISMRCIYCILVTYFHLIIQPLFQNYFEHIQIQKRHSSFADPSSSAAVSSTEEEEEEENEFEYDHQTSPLSSNRELLEQAMESSFFDLLPYFETISLLKKRKLVKFWLQFHFHLQASAIELKTCLQQFSWQSFCSEVMSPSSLSTGGLVSPSATAGRSSCCHPSDLALCLKVISKDQYFLQTSRLFPHAIYRALSRQLNCHLFLINSNLRPATAAGTTAASSTSPGLHLHSHLTQKCSQWIVHLMEKIKMGLIEAGKSPDPMNRSLTVSLSSSSCISPSCSITLSSPNTQARTPKHLPTVAKILIFVLCEELLSSGSSPFLSSSAEDSDGCLPRWLRYLRRVMTLCHPYDHLHILFPAFLPSSRPLITDALRKYSCGNLPMFTLKELSISSSQLATSPTHHPILPSALPSASLSSKMLSFYHRHVIPYSLHIKQTTHQQQQQQQQRSPLFCSLIHQSDPLPVTGGGSGEVPSAVLWTDDHDVMIQTRSTRQCLQLLLSRRLNICLLSDCSPPRKVRRPPPLRLFRSLSSWWHHRSSNITQSV